MMYWCLSYRADPRAAHVADRHYNRQHIGSPQFVPPGRCFVLLATQPRKTRRALWVTSWPFAECVKHHWAGAWVNSLFRNETFWPSAQLIRDAVAATRWYRASGLNLKWNETEPALGIITFVDTMQVKPKTQIGQCYLDAGFRKVGYTEGGLLALQLLPQDMPEPLPPYNITLPFAWESQEIC
jgi:hypothetical protein